MDTTPRISALIAALEPKVRGYFDGDKPSLTFAFGKKALDENEAPPRIVWIPTSAQYLPAEKNKTNPPRLLTRRPQVVAHCWAATFDETEELVHDLLRSLHEIAWGSIAMMGEEWLQPENVSEGHVALVTFAISVPVEGRTKKRAKITKIEPETRDAVAGDGYVEWSEP